MAAAANSAADSDIETSSTANAQKELLRFTTAGSVDDGKSTLIGRLLYDSKGVYEDQIASVRKASRQSLRRADRFLAAHRRPARRARAGHHHRRRLPLFLHAASASSSSPTRPGHEQYTRNMATGASTANLAIMLVDARKGVLPQSRRHAFIASLLGIPHCRGRGQQDGPGGLQRGRLRADPRRVRARLRRKLQAPRHVTSSRSARSKATTWSSESREHAVVSTGRRCSSIWKRCRSSDRNLGRDMRFPVQYVIRPDLDFRGYAGQVASGVIRPGDRGHGAAFRPHQPREVDRHLGRRTRRGLRADVGHGLPGRRDRHQPRRHAGEPSRMPHVSRRFEATVVWMTRKPLEPTAVSAQAHHPAGPGERSRQCIIASTSTTLSKIPADTTGAERDRRGFARDPPAAVLRSVPPESRDRRFHPDRSAYRT